MCPPQVRLAKQLTLDGTIQPESIAILSPYSTQVSEINKSLLKEGISKITACTIKKSQGEAGRRRVWGRSVLSCLPED